MDRWRGRVALVTGASSGIGAELCRTLVRHGMHVVGCARDVDRIRAIESVYAIKCDVTCDDDITALFAEIRTRFGRLDVCVNNAGLSHERSLLSTAEDTITKWRNMTDVNVLALCICTREAVKLMREANVDDGHIIHISSMSGHRIPDQTSYMYVATKCMVGALADALRAELKAEDSHIKVTCISPGLVETEFEHRCFAEDPDVARSIYDSCHCLETKDVAEAVLHVMTAPRHVDVYDVLVRPAGQTV